MRFFVIIFTVIVSFTINAEDVDLRINHYPWTKHSIKLNVDDFQKYTKLANSIGLEYHRTYGYREYYIAKQAYNIGAGGTYEYLLLSTGGNGYDAEASIRADKSPLHWEMMYFKNIDMTIIRAVKIGDGKSVVKLLKLSKGRVPDLHLQ